MRTRIASAALILLIVVAILAACRAKTPRLSAEVWRSETTLNEYRVRVEDDVIRSEWINLPPDMAEQGVYVRSECHRMGSKWVGVADSRLPCSVGSGTGERVIRWCELRTRIEIDSIAPERITGRAEGVKRVDCGQCQVLESGWKDFVWDPKR